MNLFFVLWTYWPIKMSKWRQKSLHLAYLHYSSVNLKSLKYFIKNIIYLFIWLLIYFPTYFSRGIYFWDKKEDMLVRPFNEKKNTKFMDSDETVKKEVFLFRLLESALLLLTVRTNDEFSEVKHIFLQ